MKGLQKVWAMLAHSERRQFAWLALVIFFMGLLEVIGVVSILPFIQLVADPGIVNRSDLAHTIYVYFGFENVRQMLMWAGAGVIALLILTNGFSLYQTWLAQYVSWGVAHRVSLRLLKSYLGRPYEYFLNRNTTEFTAFIIGETTHLTNGIVLPVIEVVTRILVSLIIFSVLIYADPWVASVALVTLGGTYGVIFLFQRRYLRQTGEQRIDLAVKRYQGVAELFGGIKTVKVFDRSPFFSDRYESASQAFCDIQPKYNTVVAAPRYIMEVFAFGAIVVVTIYLYLTVGDIGSIIPRLTLYALAGYRLLPSLQKAFGAIGKLVHTWPLIDKLHDALFAKNTKQWGEPPNVESLNTASDAKSVSDFILQEAITIEDLTFSYENNDYPTLKHIDLTINKGETIAFVGSTGSGKTTLVDVIVGLLRPDEGTVKIDGRPMTEAVLRDWRGSIAYVPQDVFLFDDSIARNISLKESLTGAEMEQLTKAAKLADIHHFITSELPDQYQTSVGEKGVRLSGGQRQRLGLARAFYHNPSVLILDEATSALDTVTERGIIEALDLLPEEMTTIVIAHRLSTVRHADRIFLLRDGKIAASGTYDDLEYNSSEFQEMARTS